VKDLFGAEAPDPRELPPKMRRYAVKGYASRPGSGPAGEKCRTCAHARKGNIDTAAGGFWKCALVKPTRGPGTDIRLKSPACAYWKPRRLDADQGLPRA
jgi:hypothetical protein